MNTDILDKFLKNNGFKELLSNNDVLISKNKENKKPIQLAAINDDWDVVKKLAQLIQNTENSEDNTNSGCALYYAAKENQTEIINELLQIKNMNLSWRDTTSEQIGYGAIHYAVDHNNITIVKLLLKYGYDVNIKTTVGNTTTPSPLEIALENKNLDLINLLVEHQADLTVKNKNDHTPIQQAAHNKEWDAVKILAQALQKTDNLEDKANAGSALLAAAKASQTELVAELLKIKHINLDWYSTTEKKGYGALHHAIDLNNLTMAEQLLEQGYDINKKNKIDSTICPSSLEIALENKNLDLINLLVEHQADLTVKNKYNNTPIQQAAHNKEWDAIKILAQALQKTDNLEDKAKAGSALLAAAKANQTELVAELLKIKHINLDWYSTTEKKGYGALHHAIALNNLTMAQQLLDHGYDINQKNTIDNTTYPSPLELAFQNKNRDAVRLLVENKANLTLQDTNNRTPIVAAAKNKDWELIKNLAQSIQKTDNLEDKTQAGSVVLDATREDQSEIVEELLKIKNMSLLWRSTIGKIGYGPLHYAIDNNNLSLAKQLISYGFDVNQKHDNSKISPIMVALENKNWDAIQLLAEFKANLKAKDKDGFTPIRLAAKNNQWKLVEFLVQQIQATNSLVDEHDAGDALYYAAKDNQTEVVDELLKIKKINFNWYTNSGEKIGYGALHYALDNQNTVMAEQLLKYGLSPNKQFEIEKNFYPSAMQMALENKNWTAIQLLAEYQADLSVKDKEGYTPIQAAANNNDWDLVTRLAYHIQGTENTKDAAGIGYVLNIAAMINQSYIVNQLLKINNIDLFCSTKLGDRVGYGPLHHAITHNNLYMAEQLLNYGFSTNFKPVVANKLHSSPIELAVENKNCNAIKLLAKYKADLTIQNKNKHTPIRIAALQNEWDTVFELAQHIQKSSHSNDETDTGTTILLAVEANLPTVVNELLKIKQFDRSCHIGSGEKLGFGSLHYAIFNNNLTLAEQLINHGFDINRTFEVNKKSGPTPIEVALATWNWHAIQLLIKHNADLSVVLKNSTCKLSVLIEDIIICAIHNANSIGRKNYTLSNDKKVKLQKSLIKSLLSNEVFMNAFLFKNLNDFNFNVDVFTKELALSISTSILTPKNSSGLNFFGAIETLELAHHHEIPQCFINECVLENYKGFNTNQFDNKKNVVNLSVHSKNEEPHTDMNLYPPLNISCDIQNLYSPNNDMIYDETKPLLDKKLKL